MLLSILSVEYGVESVDRELSESHVILVCIKSWQDLEKFTAVVEKLIELSMIPTSWKNSVLSRTSLSWIAGWWLLLACFDLISL